MKKINLLFGMIVLMTSLAIAQTDQTWIDLDGTNDYLDFGTDNILAGKNKFTIEMKMHFDNSGGDYTILGQRTFDTNRTIVLQRWFGAFHIFLSNGNYGNCSFIPCPGELYHIAIVYDGTGALNSDRLKLYINGILQTLTFTGTIDNSSHITTPAANLVLGCEYNGVGSLLQFVDGQFGEFCVWDYPLTVTEINSRIIPEVTGTETGLIEYFHFNNGAPGGNNTAITSFAGGKSVSTITPRNMALNGTASNFIGQPTLVNSVDTTLTVADPVIYSNATGSYFQWLDCNNAYAVIPGATLSSYTATSNGSYAVEVTKAPCKDTSACVQIITLGIQKTQIQNVTIYPNPVSNELVIENKEGKKFTFDIENSVGQVVFKGVLNEKEVVQTSGFAPGVYLLKLQTGKSSEFFRFVKE
jgi:hypothetical protein